MSTKAWGRTDKFLPVTIVVLLVLAGLAIFTFKSVFSALSTAYEVETKVPDSELRINKDKLNQAHKAAFERETVKLKIK